MQSTLNRLIIVLVLLAAAVGGYMIGQGGQQTASLGSSTPALASAQSTAEPDAATPTTAPVQPTAAPTATPVQPAQTPVPDASAPVSGGVQSDALPAPTTSPVQPEFAATFESLASEIPEIVGRPIEPARPNPGTGETMQRTTTGLMVLREVDSRVAFTNGARTWLIGPGGQIYERANGDRFEWEG